MTAEVSSTPASWSASDTEVVSWAVQACMTDRTTDNLTGELLISSTEDLSILLTAAAVQVTAHHDATRGQAEHLVTGLSLWPHPDEPGFIRVLVDLSGAETSPLLASRPVPLHSLVLGYPCGPEVAISIALTRVFALARDLIRHHQRLRIDPALASRITRWCDRYRDQRADHDATVERAAEQSAPQRQEPPSLLDVEITGCELLLAIGLGLDEPAADISGKAQTGSRRAA